MARSDAEMRTQIIMAERERLNKEHRAAMEDVAAAAAAATADLVAQLTAQRAAHAQALADAKAAAAADAATLREASVREKAILEAEHAEAVGRLNEYHECVVDSLAAMLVASTAVPRAQVDPAQVAHAQAFTEVAASVATVAASQREAARRERAALLDKHAALVAEVKAAHQATIESMAASHSTEAASHSAQIDALQEAFSNSFANAAASASAATAAQAATIVQLLQTSNARSELQHADALAAVSSGSAASAGVTPSEREPECLIAELGAARTAQVSSVQ